MEKQAGGASGQEYTPVFDNFVNINSLTLHNAGYIVLGNQVLVTLAFTKDVPDGDNQSECDVTLPIPPAFTGDDAEAVAAFSNGITAFENFAPIPIPATGKVTLRHLSNPFYSGSKLYQLGFCYRIA